MNKKIIVSVFVLFNIFASKLNAEENTSNGKNYKYIIPINVTTSNKLINGLIENNWDYKYLKKILGEPDSYFQEYYIYFKQGINVRKTEDRLRTIKQTENEHIFNLYSGLNKPDDRLYNIVFNNKYSDDILADLNINSSKSYIINKLGKPQFENTDNQIIGYKTKNFYIFFVGDEKMKEISVYKRDVNYDKAAIKKILVKAEKDKNYKGDQIVHDILTVWSDCDFHCWRKGVAGSYIEYLSRGVIVDGGERIIVKNNFIGELTDDISFPDKIGNLKNFNNKLISFELDKDSILQSELYNRLREQKEFAARVAEGEGILSPDGKRKITRNNAMIFDVAGLFIYYINNDGPNEEIVLGVWVKPLGWLSDRSFIYEDEVLFKDFVFDTLERKKIELEKGQDASGHGYRIISYKDGKIVYESGGKTYTKYYTFDQNGKIIIK